jgi:coenzyme F420-reducing hydrogenase alpha subunit
LAANHPAIALDGIRLRKWGQQVIEILGGKRIHTPWIVSGGVASPLTEAKRDEILAGLPEALAIATRTLEFFKHMMEKLSDEVLAFGNFPSLSTARAAAMRAGCASATRMETSWLTTFTPATITSMWVKAWTMPVT